MRGRNGINCGSSFSDDNRVFLKGYGPTHGIEHHHIKRVVPVPYQSYVNSCAILKWKATRGPSGISTINLELRTMDRLLLLI